MRDDPPRGRPDIDRVREALGEAGERPDRHVTPRPDDPEHQREARERLEEGEEDDEDD
jgi:hypothetical protein